jgi:hypothetical protein
MQLAGIDDRRSCFGRAFYTGIAVFQQSKGQDSWQDGIFPLLGTGAVVSCGARLSTE